MRIRCPDCHERIDTVDGDSLVDVTCPSCGSNFSLAGESMATTYAVETKIIGNFELVEQLGMGGFGTVWKANDRELERPVAIKLPRREHLAAAEVERFIREARAAAQLSHPNVVSVHEVGRQPNGQVYIVSDFVCGATLSEWMKTKPFTFREAAELIVKIASGVEHAHKKGVVHRDLKPQNILIDGEREPHITDFGLAKREAADVTVTIEGQVLGTPAYMSPQQASGEGHRVDGRADIYSLGVILFQLLTGELPFRGSSRMLMLQIVHDEPPAPRTLKSGVPHDLDTITLKCLEKDPTRRYQTASDLAADLQRWLNGQPIKARPVSSVERFARWCRRNPTIASLAAGVVALLLVVAIGSLAHSFQLSRYAENESLARDEAETYFRMTLDAIDEMLTEVGDESLAHIPQMEPVRKVLLQKALDLHRRLLESKPTNRTLQIEFARAQKRIGDLYELLGEHNEAKAAYTEAIRLFHGLQASFPNEPQVRHYLATSHTMLGEVLRATAAPEEAIRHYKQALDLQEELRRAEPENNEYRGELSRTLNNLGLALTETGQYESAESALKDAIRHLQKLIQEKNVSPDMVADLARSQINLGILLRQQPGRAAEAESAYRDAIESLDRLVTLDDQNRDYRLRLAVARLDLGNLLMDSKTEDALESTSIANTILRNLRDDFRGIPGYRYDLANSHNSLANALARLDRFDDAKTHFAHANEELDQLESDFPEYARTFAEYQSLKGRVLGGLGWLDSKHDDWKSAQTRIENAIQHQTKAAALAPDNPKFIEFLGAHHNFLAEMFGKLGQVEQAEATKKAAAEFFRRAKEMKGKPAPATNSP